MKNTCFIRHFTGLDRNFSVRRGDGHHFATQNSSLPGPVTNTDRSGIGKNDVFKCFLSFGFAKHREDVSRTVFLHEYGTEPCFQGACLIKLFKREAQHFSRAVINVGAHLYDFIKMGILFGGFYEACTQKTGPLVSAFAGSEARANNFVLLREFVSRFQCGDNSCAGGGDKFAPAINASECQGMRFGNVRYGRYRNRQNTVLATNFTVPLTQCGHNDLIDIEIVNQYSHR